MAAKKDTAPKTAAPAADKKAALETALAQIEKQFGKGAIMKLGSNAEHLEVAAIPTGALPLDAALDLYDEAVKLGMKATELLETLDASDSDAPSSEGAMQR